MSVKETPLAKVKRLHGSKEKLVDSLVERLAKTSDEGEADLKQRLMTVSNKKLLKLDSAMRLLAEKYGGKEQLVEAVSQARGKAKDQDYRAKLARYSVPRLLDMA